MRRIFLITLSSLVGALAVASGASAYFAHSGSGTATSHVGGLNSPDTISATPNGVGQVDVSWHRVTLSDGTTVAQSYYVKRYSGSTLDGYACGTTPGGTHILSSAANGSGDFTCSDTGLSNHGPYTYAVVAVYHTFTNEGDQSNEATVSLSGPLDHFVLSAATTTPIAGSADNLTITAKDSAGRTVDTYTGGHSLTFSGANSIGGNNPTVTNSSGSAIAFGSSTSIDFTAGVATVSSGSNGAMTLYKAETASIVVSDGTHNNGTGLSVTVSAAAANKLAFVQQPTNATAGVAISPAVTVAILDQYGNQTTSSAQVSISGPASLTGGNPTSASSGVATFSNLKVTTAGTGYTLTAASSGLTGATSNAFNITAGTATKLAFTTQPTNTAATSSITPAPVVTVQDANGNTVTSSSASITVSLGGSGGGTLSGTKTLSASSGVATFSGLSVDKAANNYTLSAAATGLTGATSSSFNITVGAATKLVFSQQPSGGAAGASWGTQPKVTVQDAGGNTVTTDSGSVTLAIGTDANHGTLGCANNTVSTSNGVATFTGCDINNAGTGYTLVASRTGLTSATSNTFDITGLSPTGFSIANGTGTLHQADNGDVITIPFNQAVKTSSVCSVWTTSTSTVTNVTVTMANGNGTHHNDLSFSGGKIGPSSCSGGINIGTASADTGAFNPTNSSIAWSASTVTWNSTTNALVITLGSSPAVFGSGTVSTANAFAYSPDTSIVASSNNSLHATGQQLTSGLNF